MRFVTMNVGPSSLPTLRGVSVGERLGTLRAQKMPVAAAMWVGV